MNKDDNDNLTNDLDNDPFLPGMDENTAAYLELETGSIIDAVNYGTVFGDAARSEFQDANLEAISSLKEIDDVSERYLYNLRILLWKFIHHYQLNC